MACIFPLSDSQFDYITCEQTSYIIAYKILNDIVSALFEEKPRHDSAVIAGNRYNRLVSQTSFILQKDVKEAIEFSKVVSFDRQTPPQKFRKESYSRKLNLINYKRRTPVNFVIIGYSDENLINIGRILAKKLNYLHVHPNKIVNKEIYNRTPIGLWMYENIRRGKKIPMDVIELLFSKEMCRKVYRDHGYVLSGFPIIPNFQPDECSTPDSGTDSNICIDDFPHRIKTEDSMQETDDEDVISESSIESSEEDESEEDSECDIADVLPGVLPNKKFERIGKEKSDNSSEEQPEEDEFYFSGMEDCDDDEYPEAMDETIYNFAKNTQFEIPNDLNEALKFSFKNQIKSIKSLFAEPTIIVYVANDEYVEKNVKHEIDEENIALSNLQNLLEIIDEYIAHFNREFVWIFDGRLKPDLISSFFDNRLQYLLRKEYCLPEMIFPNCYIPKYFSKYLTNDPQHNYEVLRKTNCVASKYNWFQHTKTYYCPVKSFEGKLMIGRIEYSVRFLGRIFVCSSNGSMKKFMKHPEKYVFYYPNCRIAILAPTKFGKTIISRFFTEYFQADHFNCKDVMLKLGFVSKDEFSEASKFALSETALISDLREKYYEKVKEDKIDELINIPIFILTEIINNVNQLINFDDGIFCDFEYAKKILDDDNLLKKVCPPECFEESVEMPFSNPVTRLLFEEKLSEIQYRDLVLNKELSHDFIKWLLFNKHEKNKTKHENNIKYCQWVLDGPPVDLRFWKALAKKKALPDIVILPANITLEKLENIYSTYYNVSFDHVRDTISEIRRHNPVFAELDWRKIDARLIYCKNKRDDIFIRKWGKFIAAAKYERLLEYQFKIDLLKEFLTSRRIIIIEVDYSETELNKIILRIFCEYFTYTKPKILNKKDIQSMQTKQYILDPNKDNEYDSEENSLKEECSEEEEEEMMDECEDDDSDTNNEKDDSIISELNLCNTGLFCPVCLIDNKFLIRGLLKYCCFYMNRIFVFSSKLCLNKFILTPEYYFSDIEPPEVPLAKICILGPNHVSKMHLANRLARKFNVPLKATHFFTSDRKIEYLFGEHSTEFDEVTSLNSIPKDLERSFVDGLIISGYPGNDDHFEKMLKHKFIPEAVFITDDYNTTLEALEKYFLDQYKQMRISTDLVQKLISTEDNISLEDNETLKAYIRAKCQRITEDYAEQVKILVRKFKKLNIPIIQIRQDLNPDSKTFDKICDRINNNRDRTALFDTVQVISMETAEALIKSGLYMMSRFQKSCPVQISEINCLCNYEGMSKQNKVFPCIYRQKIFFISGKEGLVLFLRNPAKYVETCNPFQLSMPLKVLVMGPPKSGISSLCRRISKEYGMKIYTESDIKEFISTELEGTRVYKEMIKSKELNPYVFSRCIRILTSSASTGIILDNLPLTSSFLLDAAQFGVDIQVTFLIQMKFDQCCEILKRKFPNSGLSEIAQGYENYYKRIESFYSKEVKFFYIQEINTVKNQWETWDTVKVSLMKTARTLISYELQIKQDRASHVYRLNVFYEELLDKLADPPLFCWVCLKGGYRIAYRYDWNNVGERFYTPECQLELIEPDGYRKEWLYRVYRFPKPYKFNYDVEPIVTQSSFEKNLIQLKNKIYWVCDDHTIEFLLNRTKYVPLNQNSMPKHIALLVLNYPKLYIANDGYCMVAYDKSLKCNEQINVIEYLAKLSQNELPSMPSAIPNRYIEGERDLAIYYRGKVFLCSNKQNCAQFLADPEHFYNLKFTPPEGDDDGDEADLKLDLGNLKPEILIKGLKALNVLRPKHFALTAEQSAATYLGLYLKTFVTTLKSNKFVYYKKLIDLFIKECNLVTKAVQTYKMETNPFIVKKQEDFEFGDMSHVEYGDIESLLNKFKCFCIKENLDRDCEDPKI